MRPDDSGDDGEAAISLVVPADARYLRTIRLTTASLLAAWDYDVDRTEDARVAVTEGCSVLWDRHGRTGTVRLTCTPALDAVHVELQLLAGDPAADGGEQAADGDGSLDGLSESILVSLTDGFRHDAVKRAISFDVPR